MRITALRLFNVRRFTGRGVAIENIGDGVNVLTAANEQGKSTSFEALYALFFLAHGGAGREVKRLQPYGGGNPRVEADIVTETGRYRLAKQFLGGKRASVTDLATGRLIAQADEAENFISALVRGGTAGPAGLLWVRQGVTGLEERKPRDEEEERRVRESLLASVQGEVEAMTGGRRMADILAACAEDFGRIATATGKPRAGGPFDEARKAEQQLAEEERQLALKVTELREALSRRAEAQKQLRELDDPAERAARREAVQRADAALAIARSHAEKLKAAEARAELARSLRAEAARLLAGFRETMDRAAALAAQRQAASERRAALLARRDASALAYDAALASAHAAEAEEAEARALLVRLDAALAARTAAEQLAELRMRLEQAEALRTEIEGRQAELARLALPKGAVERLQAAELEIARLEAAEAASRPSLRLAYHVAGPRVRLDGEELDDGEERGFGALARLDLPGIGTLTLRSNRPSDLGDTLRAARETHHARLAELGLSSLDEARRREAAAAELTLAMAPLRQRFADLAPDGVQSLRDEVARRSALAEGALELKEDPEAARRHLAVAGERLAAARLSLREVEPARREAFDGFGVADIALQSLLGEEARLNESLRPEADRTLREQALAEELAAKEGALAVLAQEVEALRRDAPDLAFAEASLARARSAEAGAEAERARLAEELAGLNARIGSRADEAVEEQWQETRDRLERATARVREFERELALLERLRTALQSARASARDLYLEPVISELRPLLGLLFDDVSITFDDTTLLPQSIRRNGEDEKIENLSGGMREQLSILTRLAFGRLLARDGRPAPVILDDALVYSDDDRIERMFDALHRQARDQQIIVFSCRQRAFSRLGGNVLHMVDWRPAD